MASCPAYREEPLARFPLYPFLWRSAWARERDGGARTGMAVVREFLRAHADPIDMHGEPGDGSRLYRDATGSQEAP